MVGFEVQGRVAVVRIDRPAKRNAVDGGVARGIEAALDRLEGDPELWVGVLAGEGPVFCAGADLALVAEGRVAETSTERGGFAGITSRVRTKPVVAAVDGPALAGGTEVVLACDLVVASTAASFGLPEVRRSLVAGAGGLLRLPRALPVNVALELAMTGEALPAERAHALGMVNRLCGPGEALGAAMDLAGRVAANAPLAVQASRRLVRELAGMDDAGALAACRAELAAITRTEDFAEGPRAFLERRPPRWVGR